MTAPESPPPHSALLRIATRQSPLALWQAEYVAANLAEAGFATTIVPLVSGGDTDMRPIEAGRQMGVFTKRIQQALLEDEGDVAVHSLKDLPTEVNHEFTLAAVPPRETVVDALVSADQYTIKTLPAGAQIGTGSRRRAAQLLHLRPDLRVSPIRGNVQTRLARLESGEFDAIVLAEAGLLRLEMHDLSRVTLSLEEMLPAPGQGALGIEVRSQDAAAATAVGHLSDWKAFAAVIAERTLLANLHGGCLAPIAAYGLVSNDETTGTLEISLTARVLSADGRTRLHEHASRAIDAERWREVAIELGRHVSESLASQGARELVEAQR